MIGDETFFPLKSAETLQNPMELLIPFSFVNSNLDASFKMYFHVFEREKRKGM